MTLALGKAAGLRRGLQISPMLLLLPLPSLSFPYYCSLHPSLPPEAFALLRAFGLRHSRGFRGGIRPPSQPPALPTYLPPSLPTALQTSLLPSIPPSLWPPERL